jgi:putative transposase
MGIIEQARHQPGAQQAGFTMDDLCGWFGITRQAHYQHSQRTTRGMANEMRIVHCVNLIRQRHPRMGGRKLLHELQPQLAAEGIQIGRDRFFDLLAQHDLLLPPPRQHRRTTWSGLWRCPNRLAGLTLTHVQQAWVCDITYLETEQGFCYLSLVTDAFSRFIVGYDVATSLAVEGALRALNMAIAQAHLPLSDLIHHSDHGVQYTCHHYRNALTAVHIVSSMGEVGNAYDNPQAERVNGILKLEYALGHVLLDADHARHLTKQAIWLYNHERPHLALDFKKPVEVHSRLHLS